MTKVVNHHFACTFNILFNGNSATCFIVEYNDIQYVVTAKHIFGDPIDGEIKEFEIKTNKGNVKYRGPILISKKKNVDIAVFLSDKKILPVVDFILEGNVTFGMDVIFLGFPYGLSQNIRDMNFNLALVKKAMVSGITMEENDVRVIYLDGHNNPGFSGGMVSYYDEGLDKCVIIGVVSGYIYQNNISNTAIGLVNYTENSGIIKCYSIGNFIEILEEHKV